MIPLHQSRLYAFVDAAYLNRRDPVELTRQLADGGADLIQLRAKHWSAEQIERTAVAMMTVCEQSQVWLVINDHPEIARRVGAPLTHLGQEDFFDAGYTRAADYWKSQQNHSSLAAAKAPEIGLSTHAPDQALRALAAGPAYIAIGPVFATPTKPGRPPVTLEYVRWARDHVAGIPWFAIGGIHRGNLHVVLEAGATRVAVVSDILNADHPERVCREYRKLLEQVPAAAAPRPA